MLWKYFQNCMYSFRENWKINLTVYHTVPCFNPQLFTISVKSKVIFQCSSEIAWPTVHGSVTWFPRQIRLIPPSQRTSFWLAHFSAISAAIWLLLKMFYQDDKFFILKSVPSFPKSASPEATLNFCYCNAI